jgi:hypothetical protein
MNCAAPKPSVNLSALRKTDKEFLKHKGVLLNCYTAELNRKVLMSSTILSEEKP